MKKMLSILLAAILLLSLSAMAETLTMASSIDFEPYEYYDDATGEIIGIDVEIAQLVCEKLGYDLEIVDMDFSAIIAALVSNKYDFGMSGFTITEERKESVNFSTPYTTTQQSVIVPEGSAIAAVEDLMSGDAAYTIGVGIGMTGDLFVTEDVETLGLPHSIERFNKAPDAIVALLSGKLDCVIIDHEVAQNFADHNEGLVVLPSAYITEEYAVAFSKDSPIYEDFNAALEELIADGTVQAIIDKYIPPITEE